MPPAMIEVKSYHSRQLRPILHRIHPYCTMTFKFQGLDHGTYRFSHSGSAQTLISGLFPNKQEVREEIPRCGRFDDKCNDVSRCRRGKRWN